MTNVFIAPRKYVQGRGVIAEIGDYLKPIGKKPMILWDKVVSELYEKTILSSLEQAGLSYEIVEFAGDSTHEEADRVKEIIIAKDCDLSVGVGGGKVLDTAKAAGANAGIKFVTVPTIASNDSPTSSYTVWYDEKGACLGFESWGVNPDLVLVDSQVIAQAPAKTFRAGMGDALATWIEVRACFDGRAGNLAGGVSTLAARTLAQLGYDLILEYGELALRAVEKNVVTPAVEKVIEANTLLSGLGFESGGCATAHMIANCLPGFEECHGLMHGEEVGFGIAVQMCLEDNRPMAEIEKIIDFEIAVGLPTTLADIGLEGVGKDRLRQIGDICASEGSLCENHPFCVTSDDIVDAIIAADALGQARKKLVK